MNATPLKENQKKIGLVCSAILFASALFMLMALLSKITLYSDDFYFGTFFDYDLRYFFENTLDHYLTANGRMLVHFLLELTLIGDIWIYLFLCPGVLALCGWFLIGSRISENKLTAFFTVTAISILLLLGLKVVFLNASLLWMSGSFNFVLPLVFVFGAVYFYDAAMEKGKLSAPLLIFSLCAGATTEQFGFFACIALWGMWIMASARKHRCFKGMWIPPLICLLGYLTVLTAPGMWGRVDTETAGLWSFLEPGVFHERFDAISFYFWGLDGCGTLLILFCVVSASLVFSSRSYPRVLLLGYPVAFLLYLCDGSDFFHGGLLFFGWLLFLGIVLVCKREHTTVGCILLGSLGTQLLLIVTAVFGYRTAMPMLLTVIFLMSLFLFEILKDRSLLMWIPVLCFVFAFSLYHYIPTDRGYAAAKIVNDQNLASLKEGKETGEVHLDLDVDTTYGYTPFYRDSYFYINFMKYYGYYGVPTPLYLEGDDYPPLYYNGKQAMVPCFVDENGNIFVSLTSLNVFFDGKNEVVDGLTHIELKDKEVWLWSDGTVYQMYADKERQELLADTDTLITDICSFTFLESETMKEIFGLELVYDEEKEIYEIRIANDERV